MMQDIIDAFREIRIDESPDVVVANCDLNRRFLQACFQRGVADAPETINRTLLNARKAGYLKGIKSRRVTVRDQDSFRYASEIAVRFLERRDGLTLDQILCDPAKASEFDAIAGEIAAGFSSFDYRWAALGLRKMRKLRPELVSKVIEGIVTTRHRVENLDTELIPIHPGVYMFHDSKNTLYVGEAVSLYKRIRKHLDHSDNKGLARWLWEQGARDLHLEIHVLPKETSSRARKALEAEMIGSRSPIFNVAGGAP
jgi:predicted GIY-YIG superfamily endonuclease